MVPRRQAERHRQLHRPPRPLRPAQQGRAHLGRRGRRRGHLHLQPSLPRGEPLRQRAAAARRHQGRPGHHLHAARPRRDRHHARLRAHRRHPLGGLRRHGHAGAALAHRRLGRQGHRRDRLHLPARQEDLAQADGGRGGARPHLRRARRRPSPRLAAGRRALRLRELARGRLLRHPAGARDPLPRRADGLRGSPVHPLHVGNHRPAEGCRAHHRRLHGRRHLSVARLLPDRRARHLLEHLGHRLDRRPLVHRLRPALGRRDRLLPRGRARLSDLRK